MSCVTAIGQGRYSDVDDEPLPRSMPPWTGSKMERMLRFTLSADPKLRAVAAAHPTTRGSRLLALLLDEDVAVRRAAVKNGNMLETFYLLAARDSDPGISAYARMVLKTEEF